METAASDGGGLVRTQEWLACWKQATSYWDTACPFAVAGTTPGFA